MARLFTAEQVIANNKRWRDRRGLGDSIQPIHSVDGPRTAVPRGAATPGNAGTPGAAKIQAKTGHGQPLERDIQLEIRDALKFHPAVLRAFRVNSGMHITDDGYKQRFIRYHDIPGMSDIWVWLKPPHAPRQAFIEVKRVGQGPSDKQAAFLEAVRALGHVGFVASNAADAFERLSAELAA